MYLLGATEPVQIHTASWATGETTCEMLTALRQTHPWQPLVLVWDNVRYHHSHKVRARAEELGIRLLYLPPYSPDLMPVERLWRWLRQDLTYLHTHRDEQELRPIRLSTARLSRRRPPPPQAQTSLRPRCRKPAPLSVDGF